MQLNVLAVPTVPPKVDAEAIDPAVLKLALSCSSGNSSANSSSISADWVVTVEVAFVLLTQ